MEENKFDQKQFQKLLRKGIGIRSQKEFAEQTGISPVTINRMLNGEKIARPKMETLTTFARSMSKVSLNELLSACGYPSESIEDKVFSVEEEIKKFIDESKKKFVVFRDLSILQAELQNSIKTENIVSADDIVAQSGGELGLPTEDIICFDVFWNHDEFLCHTIFRVYCMLTKNDQIIVYSSSLDTPDEADTAFFTENRKKIAHTTVTKQDKKVIDGFTPEDRLLHAIFGDIDADRRPTTLIGCGFYYKGVPEGFREFLNKHADVFCNIKEKSLLYQEFLIPGSDPEDVFKDYRNIDENDIFRKTPDGTGVGAVIADIMRTETGKDFFFFSKDSNLPEDAQNECIMFRMDHYPEQLGSDIIAMLYSYAKELGIPEFGMVYYNTTCVIKENLLFETNKMYLS